MRMVHSAFVLAALCTSASAAVRSGKAEADWISTSSTYEPGKPIQMAIRLVIDPGWHSYWLNPGEGGMKTSVKWNLPAGWTAGELEHPIPERFIGGGLASFGYKGTIVFPVELSSPADTKGSVTLKAVISWLTCDDQACVPGKAELSVTLENGIFTATPEEPLIIQALTTIPRVRKEWGLLDVIEKEGRLFLGIPLNDDTLRDFTITDVFPVTIGVIDADQKIQLAFQGSQWTGIVPKSKFAKAQTRELSLALAGKPGQPPVMLHWKIE